MAAPPASAADCLDALAASCDEEEAADIGLVCSALCRIHTEYTARLQNDQRWCDAYARAADAAGAESSAAAAPRVLVVGLGSGVPALAAARAGCSVVWAQRAALTARHLQPVSSELCSANGVCGSVRVARVRQWDELRRVVGRCGRFDAVLTEEFGDDPLAEGILPLARLCREHLLVVSSSPLSTTLSLTP